MEKRKSLKSGALLIFVLIPFLSSCSSSSIEEKPELNDASATILGDCIDNWNSSPFWRERFLSSLGNLDEYSQFMLIEIGNSDHVVYDAYFIGYLKGNVLLKSTNRVEQEVEPNSNSLQFFKLVPDLKNESIEETYWPTRCNVVTYRQNQKGAQAVNFSILNDEDDPYKLSKLDSLIIKVQKHFESLN